MLHNKEVDEVLQIVSSRKSGLSETEVIESRNKYGSNLLIKKKNLPLVILFFKNMIEPMMLILLIALAFTLFLSFFDLYKTGVADFKEAYGIIFSILLSNIINVWMEGKSRRAFDSISRLQNQGSVWVLRDGREVKIKSENIVVGDILLLKSGDKIYADGRIIEANQLEINESSLTGETHPITKKVSIISLDSPLAERNNMAYSGTYIVGGNGKIVVTNVGYETELGKIADSLREESTENTPLEEQLRHLSKILVIIGVVVAIIMFFLSIILALKNNNFTKELLNDSFITATIYIVSAVPEGLPGIVAISLAINVVKMSKQNALVKRMVAVETIGRVSVICSDKTGTITANKMTLCGIYENLEKVKYPTSNRFLTNIIHNHTLNYEMNNQEILFYGNPTECAILSYFQQVPTKKIKVITPFSSTNKYMEIAIDNILYIKGAPEVILEKTNLSYAKKDKILREIEVLQLQAERVIAYGSKSPVDNFYQLDGYISLVDPIKEEVYEAVNKAKAANIRIIVITGDSKNTALAICNKLGLIHNNAKVLSGDEIDNMPSKDLKKELSNIVCIYRATPGTKLKMIEAYKMDNKIVAMTGDGINDALALKEADVGLAMGINGTEVAKEASDIILLDDSFATIIKAIGFGRNIYKNFKKFIMFQVTVNISFIILLIITMILDYPSPFNALELLWINIIMDGPPALALGTQNAKNDELKIENYQREDKILAKRMLGNIIIASIIIAMLCILQTMHNFIGGTNQEQKSIIFSMFVFMQLANILNIAGIKNVIKQPILLLSIIITGLIQVIIVNYASFLFGLEPLSTIIWIKILLTVIVSYIFNKILKIKN